MTDAEDRVTIWLSRDLRAEVEEHVDWRYGSLSGWMREAARQRITLENALAAQDLELPEDAERRQELVERVVRLGVAAGGDELVEE